MRSSFTQALAQALTEDQEFARSIPYVRKYRYKRGEQEPRAAQLFEQFPRVVLRLLELTAPDVLAEYITIYASDGENGTAKLPATPCNVLAERTQTHEPSAT